MKIKELYSELLAIMPSNIAFDWDNVGLLIGDGQAEVKKVLLSLDVTPLALEKALKEGCNLIIAHHPLIFSKINRITNPLYLQLIRANIDVICMHTNLDSIPRGVNRILADKLGLRNLRFLSKEGSNKVYWGKIIVPHSHFDILRKAILKAGAGTYEDSNSTYVTNQVRASRQAKSDFGDSYEQEAVIELQDEIEIQFRVDKANLKEVISAIVSVHPYERPLYHFYEITDDNLNYGSGMVGELDREMTLDEFASQVKMNLNAPFVKLWKGNNKGEKIKRVAVCGGSGSFLLREATSKSDLLVTGDVTYHTMLDSALPIIDAGHFYTEYPVLEILAEIMDKHKVSFAYLTAQEHEVSKLIIK